MNYFWWYSQLAYNLLGDLRWKIVKQKKKRRKRLATELKLRHFLLEEKKIAMKIYDDDCRHIKLWTQLKRRDRTILEKWRVNAA